MLPFVAIALLALSPTMAGPPPAALGSPATDYTTSFALTGPATGAQCTNAAITTDQSAAISVSRASSSYCQKNDGTYVLISSNLAVVESEGIRIEPAATNLVTYSEALSANWTLTNLTISDAASLDPVGTQTASEFNTSSAGGLAVSPAFTISSTSATLSAWVNNAGAGTATLILRDTTAGADRCTITVTTATSYPSTMYGRQSCTSAAITSGNTHVVRFYPGGVAGSNTLVKAWGVQVEAGVAVKSSYIPTSGTAASRAADVITTTIADNTAAGCAGATFKATAPGFPQRLFSKGADMGAFNNTASIFAYDGTNTTNSTNVSNMTDRSVPFRSQWGGTAVRVDLDSNTGTPGTFDGSMGAGTTLYIGSNSGVQQFQGWIKAIKLSTSTSGCTP